MGLPTSREERENLAGEGAGAAVQRARRVEDGWTFEVGGTGFAGTLLVAVDPVAG